jgi:hypothetical protein
MLAISLKRGGIMCDCEKEIKEHFKRREDADIVHVRSFGWNEISYRTPRKKDGKPCERFKTESYHWNYCPFCGVKIEVK